MISIIVPIYNTSKSLPTCIESILCQTYSDFELILINDGSSDSSEHVCKEYAAKDERIKFLSKPNSGVGATRNLGLSVAKGEWICFIDSDDVVKPYYLESFNLNSSEADLVISGIEFFDIQLRNVFKELKFKDRFFNYSKFRNNVKKFLLIGFPYGKAYRKSIIHDNEIKFPEDISFHEDHVFVLDYLLHISSIETSSKIGYIYNIDYSCDSLSKKKYSWKPLTKAGDYMLGRVENIRQKFNIPIQELTDVFNFCYTSKVEAVFSLYESNLQESKKRQYLRKIMFGKYSIKKYYHPKDKKGLLIKLNSQILPIPILHLFFKVVSKYQNRHK